jgi:hypothetical protein
MGTKLDDVRGLLKEKDKLTDPELKKVFDRAVTHLLDSPRSDDKGRMIAFYSVVGLFVIFALLAGATEFLAAWKLLTVDKQYLDKLWVPFVIDLSALAVWLVKQAWSRK